MATTMKLIAKNVLGSDAADVTFSSIPGTYDDLLVLISARNARTNASDNIHDLYMKINTVTTNRSRRSLEGNGAAASSGSASDAYIGSTPAATATSSTFGSLEIYIPNYAGSTNKSFLITGVTETNATTAYIQAIAGLWSSTAAITELNFYHTNWNTLSGSSFFLYGIKKA